jgi:toxin HigB-1
VIISFKDSEAERIFNLERSKKLPAEIQPAAVRKLVMIHSANRLSDLASPPGNHLEQLFGDREGQYSIRINDKYRICFKWVKTGGAAEVEITDYH